MEIFPLEKVRPRPPDFPQCFLCTRSQPSACLGSCSPLQFSRNYPTSLSRLPRSSFGSRNRWIFLSLVKKAPGCISRGIALGTSLFFFFPLAFLQVWQWPWSGSNEVSPWMLMGTDVIATSRAVLGPQDSGSQGHLAAVSEMMMGAGSPLAPSSQVHAPGPAAALKPCSPCSHGSWLRPQAQK